jgi:NADH-quinone oxidoreductase subunit J
MNPVLFGILAVMLIAAAANVVLQRSPIRSALSLVVTLFLLAVVFLFLDAQLVAALQVIVYAGAIMVLFLFVIMLLNLQQETQAMAKLGTRFAAGFVASLFLLAVIRLLVARSSLAAGGAVSAMGGAVPASFGSTEELATLLFTRYLLPFEITSVLLLVGIIGAVVLAKRTLK